MKIKSVEFIKSSKDLKDLPKSQLNEFAFIGRSNVGKSSLINLLVNKKGVAKISSKPGKTQLINHFLVNEEWYLVDLPGYGYAKTSKKDIKEWNQFTIDYILKREHLLSLFVLIDVRLEPQKIDLEFMKKMGLKGISFAIVFTKIDKLSSSKLKRNLIAYQKRMLTDWEEMPISFTSSTLSKIGAEPILDYIEACNKI